MWFDNKSINNSLLSTKVNDILLQVLFPSSQVSYEHAYIIVIFALYMYMYTSHIFVWHSCLCPVRLIQASLWMFSETTWNLLKCKWSKHFGINFTLCTLHVELFTTQPTLVSLYLKLDLNTFNYWFDRSNTILY